MILPTAFIDVVPAGLISLIKGKLKKLFISTVYVAFCLLGLLLSALCQSWHVHLSGFPSSALPGLPLAQLPWQLLLSPELFAFSSCPFPSATPPNCSSPEFPPVNKQGFPPLALGSLHPCTHCQGSGGCSKPLVSQSSRSLPGQSREPVLRTGTDARGDCKVPRGYWIQLAGAGAAKAAHFLPTERSPALQPGKAGTQIPALGHSSDCGASRRRQMQRSWLSSEAVIKIHSQ